MLTVIKLIFIFIVFLCLNSVAHPDETVHEYSRELAHYPSPLPDRVVLTWNDDPATTQAVNWRTDVSVKAGLAQLAVANANGRELKPVEFKAETSYFKSDINEISVGVFFLYLIAICFMFHNFEAVPSKRMHSWKYFYYN